MERLNRWLARCGVASRRSADRLIEAGRVTVNGQVVSRLGTRIEPGRDAIKVDGRRVGEPPPARTYLMLHKPTGVLTTLHDPEGRPTIVDLLPGKRPRLFPVGRLDFHSEGLLLLTDDGDLARDLMHPRCGVPRTYAVKVRGQPDRRALDRLEHGIRLDGRPTRPARVRLIRRGPNSWLEVTLQEGRKHHVRRMFDTVGHPVVRLRRIAYGGVALGRLPPRASRALRPEEVRRLREAAMAGRRASVDVKD